MPVASDRSLLMLALLDFYFYLTATGAVVAACHFVVASPMWSSTEAVVLLL